MKLYIDYSSNIKYDLNIYIKEKNGYEVFQIFYMYL